MDNRTSDYESSESGGEMPESSLPRRTDTSEVDLSLTWVEKKEGFGGGPTVRFTEKRKSDFLEMAKRFWPNMTKICALSGVAYSTFQRHLEVDPEFRANMDAVKHMVLDDLEGISLDFARSRGGFLDRISILRAHRPERWDRTRRVEIKHELDVSTLDARRQNLQRIVAQDAEVIEAVTGKPVLEIPGAPIDPDKVVSPEEEITPSIDDLLPEPDKPTEGLPRPENNSSVGDAPMPLDSLEDFCQTSSAMDHDLQSLRAAKKPSPKKTNRVDSLEHPPHPSPRTKNQEGSGKPR